MNKDQAKKEIERLISKYELVKSTTKVKSYKEEETKKDFILPLFRALGWNVEDKNEVSAEEHELSSGRVDYGFYINDRAKFYLEAKPLKANLNIEDFAKQSIRYSFNRGVTWAILTDFEAIKVFNAQSPSQYLGDKLYFEIKYSEYIDRFDQLWLLSKEAFGEDLIDKEAEKVGKKLQKIPINEQLSKDLNECRKLLINYLGQWNPGVSKDDLDEGVQKLLDRLIFIRVAEDRKIEANILIPLLNQWRTLTGSDKPKLYQSMAKKFRELDSIYNSSLFTPHPFENWEDDGGGLEKVIKILHGKEGYYNYDFSVITADTLGSVYENYLGYKLSQSQKGLTLDKSASKRKEQGIYYTPPFVVDYIVRNALKPVLDKCTSITKLKKIKILDPACGSGSFLTKALEVILEKYEDFNVHDSENLRIEIIFESLYGVDLDEQAVEIARLNLLINTLKERRKLPFLESNIKNGNSLISGTDEELEKYFGKNFRDKKPFDWKEQFPEVFKQGGFDVIIGNPPWVSLKGKFKSVDFSEKEIEFLTKKYESNTYAPNLYEMFIYLSLNLLKDGGYFSFIIPDRLASNEQFIKLRKHILENFNIEKLLFDVEFPGVTADTMIFTIHKNKSSDNSIIEIGNYRNREYGNINQNLFTSQDDYSMFYIDRKIFNVFNKISSRPDVKALSEYADCTSGCGAKTSSIYSERSNHRQIQIVKGENIRRYGISGNYWFEFIRENITGRTTDRSKLGVKNKILLRKTGADIIATFDDSGIFPEQSLYFIFGTDKNTLLYILGILNSKLMNCYYKNFAITNRSSTPQLKNVHLNKFPIINANKNKNSLVNLVIKMLNLNKKLSAESKASNKWNSIKDEIQRTGKKIDGEVYKLYGLTPEEIKLVEAS